MSHVPIPSALRRGGWVPNSISTIVIYCVFRPNPMEPTPLQRIQILELPLVPPPHPLTSTKLSLDGGLTSIYVEASIASDKRRFGPVRLLPAATRCPIISIPQTRVDLHRLLKRESNSKFLVILEHPNRDLVNIKSVSIPKTRTN